MDKDEMGGENQPTVPKKEARQAAAARAVAGICDMRRVKQREGATSVDLPTPVRCLRAEGPP